MKICVVRNAEITTNASMKRVVSAILASSNTPILLSRSRYNNKKGIYKKEYCQEGSLIDNYEINIPTKVGRGLINIFQLVKYQVSLFNFFRKNQEKFDILHVFDFDAGIIAYIFSKIYKKKYIYHIADFYVDSRGIKIKFIKNMVRGLEYKVIEKAETTIICTEQRREQIKGSNPKNLVVVHNTPSIKIEKPSEVKNPKLTFTYVGTLSKSRFIIDIIDIFKEHKNFDLKLAGMGIKEDYVKDISLEYDNIHYYGMIDYDEALNLYSKTDLMFAIYNSEKTNYRFSAPNKVYESMMLGKPIVVAKGTGVDAIVEEENMGFVIDYSKESFIDLLKKIEENPKILDEKAANASKVYGKYSWETMKKRLVRVYENI